MFGTASDYHELNAGAHRKAPKNLKAPALVRHLAFWTDPNQYETGSPEDGSDQIKDALDTFIVTLCSELKGKGHDVELIPNISSFGLLFNNFYHKTLFCPVAGPLTMRQYDIFKSISRAVLLKFKWQGLDIAIRFEIHTEHFSISTFVEFDKDRRGPPYSGLADLNFKIAEMLEYMETGDATLPKPINSYFFHDFWTAYEGDIFSHASVEALMRGSVFQQIFADLRGFIVSEQAISFGADADSFDGNKHPNWGPDAKKKFLPLIQSRESGERGRYECAVSYLLDGRALYMSTLGPQLPSMPMKERIPLEFIVYAHQRPQNSRTIVNKWQLGRLINQLLFLDTLRLCALKDVKLLYEAGRQLGLLDQRTQAARDAIASNDNRVIALIRDAHQRLDGITGDFLKKTGSGLLYRIERSRYYVTQFEANMSPLRIRRIDGDQPYDQFIERRLGSEFDFIDRLGRRYERATRNMVTLHQNYLAITQNALVTKANRIDEEIHTIQEWGEFALLAALVPYYVAHLLDLIIAEKYVTTTTVVIWTVSAAFAFYRLTKKLWPSALIILAVLGLVNLQSCVDYSWLLRSHEAPGESTQKRSGDEPKKEVAPPPEHGAPASGPAAPLPKG